MDGRYTVWGGACRLASFRGRQTSKLPLANIQRCRREAASLRPAVVRLANHADGDRGGWGKRDGVAR
jgi:hypothetical protein